jgi:uncharacterized protein YwqG
VFRRLLSRLMGRPKDGAPALSPVTDIASAERMLRGIGLGDHAADLARLCRPSVLFDRQPGKPAPCGASKLGGLPDLPPDIEWPVRPAFAPSLHEPKTWRWTKTDVADWIGTAQPLSFLAQVNLSDVAARAGTETDLPRRGMLWFFYDLVYEGWGYDPADAPGFRVLYAPDPKNLAPRQPPQTTPALHRFHEVALLPVRGFDLPQIDGLELERQGLDGNTADAYRDAIWEAVPMHAHKMGGWARPVQNPMEEECAMVTEGLYLGDAKAWHSDDGKRILAQPNDWTLLLQIDDDDDAGMQWVDTGGLYFWIRAADLRVGRFDRVWVILQTT